MRRRSILGGFTALSALAAIEPIAAHAAPARAAADIGQRPSARIVIDNDFAGDPDGLIALAHQLLSPKTQTVLVTTSALDPHLAKLAGAEAGQTAAAGARLARQLLERLGKSGRPAVIAGAESFGAGQEQVTAAARAIVAEAMRDDPLPLFVGCAGPLTNIAAALRLEPAIAGRMKLIWIGGSSAPEGGAEYNLITDLAAARYVFETSAVEVWQITEAEYKRFQVSVAEMSADFRSISPLAKWLYDQYRNLPPFVQLGGSLTFGDSPIVSLSAFDPLLTPSTLRPARRILDKGLHGQEIEGRQVRMYHGFDVRLNLADFFALLRSHRPIRRGR